MCKLVIEENVEIDPSPKSTEIEFTLTCVGIDFMESFLICLLGMGDSEANLSCSVRPYCKTSLLEV